VDFQAKLRNYLEKFRPKADRPPASLAKRIFIKVSEALSRHKKVIALANTVVMIAIGWPISIVLSCSGSRWARGEL
jgi:hypothetical protein